MDCPENSFLETMMPWSEEYREYEKVRKTKGPPELMENEYWKRPRSPGKKRRQELLAQCA